MTWLSLPTGTLPLPLPLLPPPLPRERRAQLRLRLGADDSDGALQVEKLLPLPLPLPVPQLGACEAGGALRVEMPLPLPHLLLLLPVYSAQLQCDEIAACAWARQPTLRQPWREVGAPLGPAQRVPLPAPSLPLRSLRGLRAALESESGVE